MFHVKHFVIDDFERATPHSGAAIFDYLQAKVMVSEPKIIK